VCVGDVSYLGECGLRQSDRDMPMTSMGFGRRLACPLVNAMMELIRVAVRRSTNSLQTTMRTQYMNKKSTSPFLPNLPS